MDKIIIEGGKQLKGTVAISGSKNAVLPVLAATILTSGKNDLENVPRVRDVTTMIKLLQDLGAKLDYFEKDKVITINNVETSELPNFYKYSQLYVFSSYCEVFGLTSLEAMTQGCPVLISNTSALPEINNNASDYFDPDNIVDIKNKIKKILIDENHRSNLIKNGEEHIKKFTWQNNVEKTLVIINS